MKYLLLSFLLLTIPYTTTAQQIGGGLKYQLTTNFSFELLYTNFVTASSGGAGQTFNLGLRFLK